MNTLEEAKKNPTKHNAEMRKYARELEDEAEDFESESDEFLELLTEMKKSDTEVETKEITLLGKTRLSVYVDLSGEQEELIAKINSVHRESKKRGKNNTPDMEKAITASTDLCASLIVPEEGRPWHKPNTWRALHRGTSLEEILEILTKLLKPYEDKRKKMTSFR